MAETVVSFVLENLSRLVTNEANLLCGVEDKVKFLESHLGMMSVFLESCEQNQRKKPIEQEILRQIKDIAHEADSAYLMAETVVSFVLENLSRLVTNEANLLCGVEDKVKFLESHLGMMSVFLESCEQNQRKKPIEQEILRQIKDIAHEAEDVIDTFVVNFANYRRRSRLSRILHGASHAKLRRHVAKEIDNINARLNYLHENKIKYDNTQDDARSSTDQELRLLHKRRRDVEEDGVVGFEHDTTEVINRLKQGVSRRNVVSIIGMGGLGKTTLARKIYNSHHVKGYFECHAWVSVSNDYRPREILHALLKCLMSTSANTSYYNNNSSSKHKKKSKGKGKAKSDGFYSFNEKELKDKVRVCLKGKRYLVVLDDIWRPQHWDDIQSAFPDDNISSRILITSRLGEVASRASSSPPYHLPFLSEEESWELFSKRVFGGEDVPPELELLGKRMVRSCAGLPISIVVLAGILANKEKSYRVWSKIMGHVNSYLTRPETQVHDIVLKLSYDSLPQRLKSCFLYFGMFPEDYEIPVRRLIHLWVAEGFILHRDSRIVEDVAEYYLDELIDRSLIQEGRRRKDGGIKTCRIHDLLRELCIFEGKKQKVFEVCRDADINLEQTRPRRLSIQCNMFDFFVSNNKDLSATRSMLCFDCNPSYDFDLSMSKRLVRQIQLVRVLALRLPISSEREIPTNLNMLVHLRYLRLYIDSFFIGQFQIVITNFICNLWNLETLELVCPDRNVDISFCSGIWKLKRLRHLYTSKPIILPELFSDIESNMWNLQTLSCVVINKQSAVVSLIRKGVFPKLRTLALHFDEYGDKDKQGVGGQVWEYLPNLNYLNALKIFHFPDIPTSVKAFPSNLTKLTISGTMLSEDVMSTLGSHTNLRILKLCLCSFTKPRSVMRLCSINEFPLLEVFQMKHLHDLYSWELGKNVMPCLRCLIIQDCIRLIALPDELSSLTSLRKVQVVKPSKSVKKQLQSRPMRDGCNLIIS